MQIGREVSFTEISKTVGADAKTVKRYIDILEKTFVIKKVSAYSKNPRTEIATKAKYYFYDFGVRNGLLGQYNEMSMRNDVGFLWENFVFMEFFKKNMQKALYGTLYFWRAKNGAEVDIIYEQNGTIRAYECKWNKDQASFGSFLRAYPDTPTAVVSKDNFSEVLESL